MIGGKFFALPACFSSPLLHDDWSGELMSNPNTTRRLTEKEIFFEALDRHSPQERNLFLDGACGENSQLRAAVDALLVDHFQPDRFMNEPALDSPSEMPLIAPAVLAAPMAERYHLLELIGEGGFGEVWMAEQREPVQRRVALKVLKPGMDTRQVVARFEAERQTLAIMDHPYIATIFDAGVTDAGRPYFVMELVQGIRITDFCDQNRLPPAARLNLFLKVCQAVQHAHQKGVIHRDIKPSNILVALHDGVPVPKVIDFGVAKATRGQLTEHSMLTQFQQFIGTPAYMSPEQATLSGLDIDTRSDIYALGVVLYELLTGKPPFDARSLISAGYGEMQRIIREVEPPKPSSRLSTVAGEERSALAKARHITPDKVAQFVEADLDWIVMKAIEKDRTRRYETANAFAEDIARYLHHEPVLAAAPSASYRFRKFARRNRATIGIVAGITLVLVAATIVSTWQAVRATRAREQSEKDRQGALAAQKREQDAREDAEAVASFLTNMFQSSEPGSANGGRDVKVADVLDRAVKALDSTLSEQPERLARLRTTLATTYEALGLFPEAIALQQLLQQYGQEKLGTKHPDTLLATVNLAALYIRTARTQEAIDMLEEALPILREVHGPEAPPTLSAQQILALAYHEAGSLDKALLIRQQMLELSRRVNGENHPDTLVAKLNLANSYCSAHRLDEALSIQKEVLALMLELHGLEHPRSIDAMINLAVSHSDLATRDDDLEQLKKALTLGEEALALRRKILGEEHPATLNVILNLGTFYFMAFRIDEAIAMREKGLSLSRKILGPEHPETLVAMMNLAISKFEGGHQDEGLAMQEEVLVLTRRIRGPGHPDTGHAAGNLGFLYDRAGAGKNGNGEKTIAAWQEAVRIQPSNAWAQYYLGELLVKKGRLAEALAPLQASRDLIPTTDPLHAENKARLERVRAALSREKKADGTKPETAP